MLADTTPDADRVRVAIYRRMSPAQRCAIAAQMSEDARSVALAGIRSRHPDYDEEQLRYALFRCWSETLCSGAPGLASRCSSRDGSPRRVRSSARRDRRPPHGRRLVRQHRFYVDAEVARDALRRRSMFNVIDVVTAWKLDLVIRKARPFSIEELRRSIPAELLGVPVRIATAEDTIIAKLEWATASGSDRQLIDVAGILRVRGEHLDRAYLQRWVADLGLDDAWRRGRRSLPDPYCAARMPGASRPVDATYSS